MKRNILLLCALFNITNAYNQTLPYYITPAPAEQTQTFKTNVKEIYEVEGVSKSKLFYTNTEFRFSDKLIYVYWTSERQGGEVFQKFHVQKKENSIIKGIDA